MEKMHFSIVINAPREKVWNTMLGKETYEMWTDVFGPGSHYIGDWKKGSKILFLAPGKSGTMEGMVSRIEESRPYDFISIEHMGIVHDGKEDTTSDEVKAWAGVHENYTFRSLDNASETRTEVIVDMDLVEEFKEMFENMWPKALEKLKTISEN